MCPPQQGSHPHPLLIITNDNSDLQWSLWPQFGMKMLCAVLAITYLVLVAKVDGPNDLKDMFSGCFLVQPAGVLLQLLCNHQNIESRSQCAESYRVWCGPHTRTPGTVCASSGTPKYTKLPLLGRACSLLQCKTVKFGLFLKVLLPTPRHFGVNNQSKQQTGCAATKLCHSFWYKVYSMDREQWTMDIDLFGLL